MAIAPKKVVNPYKSGKLSQRQMGYVMAFGLGLILILLAFMGVSKIVNPPETVQLVSLESPLIQTKVSSGEPTIIMLYDENCGNCAKQVDQLRQLSGTIVGSKVQYVLVSIDSEPDATAEFIRKNPFPKNAPYYYAAPASHESIRKVLKDLGLKKKSNLPVVATFDQGVLLTEYNTYVPAVELKKTLDQMVNRAS